MPKFTQGKWEADKFGDSIYFCDKDGNKVHFIKIQGENPVKIQANARLIASAPEMYEELCDALEFFQKGEFYRDETKMYIKSIAELLARIDGEEEE